jgi:hypothetical protein
VPFPNFPKKATRNFFKIHQNAQNERAKRVQKAHEVSVALSQDVSKIPKRRTNIWKKAACKTHIRVKNLQSPG